MVDWSVASQVVWLVIGMWGVGMHAAHISHWLTAQLSNIERTQLTTARGRLAGVKNKGMTPLFFRDLRTPQDPSQQSEDTRLKNHVDQLKTVAPRSRKAQKRSSGSFQSRGSSYLSTFHYGSGCSCMSK